MLTIYINEKRWQVLWKKGTYRPSDFSIRLSSIYSDVSLVLLTLTRFLKRYSYTVLTPLTVKSVFFEHWSSEYEGSIPKKDFYYIWFVIDVLNVSITKIRSVAPTLYRYKFSGSMSTRLTLRPYNLLTGFRCKDNLPIFFKFRTTKFLSPRVWKTEFWRNVIIFYNF